MIEPDTQNRSMPGAVVFGAAVGLLHGAAAGLICCWLAQKEDFYCPAVAAGATIGGVIGALIGTIRGKERGGGLDPDIGMWTGICCGIIPAVFIFAGIGIGFGKLGLGGMFVCPMVGLLTGGICDRLYETHLRNDV